MNSVQIIQLMLAPAFALAGCATLLQTTSRKSSNVATSLRSLEREGKIKQAKTLLKRMELVRNAIFCFQIAIAFIVVSSCLIGLAYFIDSKGIGSAVIITFVCALISVLVGMVILFFETKKGYAIIYHSLYKDKK